MLNIYCIIGILCLMAINPIIGLFIRYEIIRVTGVSMQPTYYDGDFVLIDKKRPKKAYKEGDILVYTPPTGDYLVIKRVGAVVKVRNIPYFMMYGDNRDNSIDSRNYGGVPYNFIEGKVVLSWKRKKNRK